MKNPQSQDVGSRQHNGFPWRMIAGWLLAGAGVVLLLGWYFSIVVVLPPALVLAVAAVVVSLIGRSRNLRQPTGVDDCYRDLFDNSDEVYFRSNAEGVIEFLNGTWEDVTEFSCAESLAKPLRQFVYTDDLENFDRLLQPLRERETKKLRGEIRLVTASDSYRWVEITISAMEPSDGSAATAWVGIIRNVTARRLTEDAVRESEERYRRIFQNIQDVYFEISLGGLIVEISPSVELITGHRRDQLIGRVFETISADPSDIQGIKDSILEQRRIVDHEIEMRNRDGSLIPCSIHARIATDMHGKPLKIVGSLHDISERKRAEQEIRQLAYHDTLTGLPNRSLFNDRLEQALAHAKRHNDLLGVLFLDLDRFKDVNDTLGHCSGDLLLQSVSQRLSASVRKSDTVARLGGDEFVVLLTSVKSDRDVSHVAEKIMTDLADVVEIEGQEVFTTVSMGVVLFPHDGGDAEALMKHADMAMYEAKDKGKNNYQFFSEEMNRKAIDRHQLEFKLRRALERDEFSLYYQPQWDMQGRRLVGLEALLRWTTEQDGMIPPNRFIPVAEDTGLIRPIGEWVLRTACRQLKTWQKMGYGGLRMAVNISARQFRQPDLVSKIDKVLAETGIDPQYLELELTESYLMEDAHAAIRTLEFLKVRGIQLAIDDFGTGYSSLNYLKNFPIDRIKIDQSFVRDVTVNRDDAAIVEAIIAMGQSLDLELIAEGVEGSEQLKFLLSRNCFEMQGYFFARPMPTSEMDLYLEDSYQRRRSGRVRSYPIGDELEWSDSRMTSSF